MVVYLLDCGKTKEALKFSLDHQDTVNNPAVMVKPLADAYLKSQDFPSVAALLKHLHKQSLHHGTLYDAAGQFLVYAMQGMRDAGDVPVVELMNHMVRAGLKISNGVTSHIESGYRGRVPSAISALLDKLTVTADGRSVSFDGDEFGKHPRNMNVDELENHLLVCTLVVVGWSNRMKCVSTLVKGRGFLMLRFLAGVEE